MRSMLISFRQFLSQISRDSMLIFICISPIMIGAFFKFGIPVIEKILCKYLIKIAILSPYYLLFDISLAVITPYMFCFASAMTILEERDANIANYLSVTPVGKSGYLISRLGFPTAISAVFSVFMLLLFSLTNINLFKAIALSILTAPIGIIIALLIVSLSANKVEGMALAKLGNIIMLGVAIPFFITNTLQYFGAFLPSFWVAKSMLEFSFLHLVLAFLISSLWIAVLYGWFQRKIQ